MESNIIEFCGELSDQFRIYLLKNIKIMLWISVLITFILFFLPIIILCVIFAPLIVTVAVIIVIIFICLVVPLATPKEFLSANSKTVKVIIENEEIAALNAEQISKLNSQSGGINSLNIDGYYITNIKSIFEVVKVVDYGEWYGIYFNSRHIFTDYICQKNLITKGTFDEFEKLFEGKLKRRRLN